MRNTLHFITAQLTTERDGEYAELQEQAHLKGEARKIAREMSKRHGSAMLTSWLIAGPPGPCLVKAARLAAGTCLDSPCEASATKLWEQEFVNGRASKVYIENGDVVADNIPLQRASELEGKA